MAQTQTPNRHPHQETDVERTTRAQREEAQAREDAEKATAHLARQGERQTRPLSPEEAAKEGEDTVMMMFPTPVTLTMPGYIQVYFPAGINEVPVSLSTDPYLEASGATKMTARQAAAAQKTAEA